MTFNARDWAKRLARENTAHTGEKTALPRKILLNLLLVKERNNMKVTVKVSEGVTVEADGATVAEVFEQVARIADVFAAQTSCGLCQGRYRFQVRDAKGYRFYELACLNPKCGARFPFGQLKEVKGGLFPKGPWSIWRKSEDGGSSEHEFSEHF